jgi:hypothetical protein
MVRITFLLCGNFVPYYFEKFFTAGREVLMNVIFFRNLKQMQYSFTEATLSKYILNFQ